MMMRASERKKERERERASAGRVSARSISTLTAADQRLVGRSVGCKERTGRTDQEEEAGKSADSLYYSEKLLTSLYKR